MAFGPFVLVCLLVLSAGMSRLHAQSSTGTIQGTVVDQSGHALEGATIAVISESGDSHKVLSGAEGKFTFTGIPAGSYTVQICASGFSTMQEPVIVGGATESLPITLSIASVSEEVTVEAEADTSIAAELAPVKSLLDAGSARTEITSTYVANTPRQ